MLTDKLTDRQQKKAREEFKDIYGQEAERVGQGLEGAVGGEE